MVGREGAETEVILKVPANRRCRGTDRLRANYVGEVCMRQEKLDNRGHILNL